MTYRSIPLVFILTVFAALPVLGQSASGVEVSPVEVSPIEVSPVETAPYSSGEPSESASAGEVSATVTTLSLPADVYATPGSMAYYQQELGRFGAGYASVGASGAVQYSYPMGRVSLTYSSQGGWRVDAGSAIRRSTRWGVPKYTDSDVYELDGMELIPDNPSSGENPLLFHTRRQSYARIRYYNRDYAYPNLSYWEVTRKDGSVSYYGYYPPAGDGQDWNARIDRAGLSNDQQPRVWALSYTRDAGSFNFIRYLYDRDTANGQYYLSKIVSGKLDPISHQPVSACEATLLYYETCPLIPDDTALQYQISYREGAKVKTTRRVKSVLEVIDCDGGGAGGVYRRGYKVSWYGWETPTPQPQYSRAWLVKSVE